jgi:hypothetical protein
VIRSSPPSAATADGVHPTLLAVVLLLVHGLLAWWLRIPSITTGNDDATYLLLARAVRQWSYADIWIVGAPPHTKYPPIFPATIAAVQSIAGERLDVVLAVNILLSVAALGLVYAIVSRHSRWLAVAVIAICAVNPSLVASAGRIHSEPLFMLLTGGSLFFLMTPTPTRRTRIGAAVMAIAAALTRSIGVTVIGTVLLYWVIRRERLSAAALVIVTMLTVGPWLTWTMLAPKQLAGYSYLGDAMHRTTVTPPARTPDASKKDTAAPASGDTASGDGTASRLRRRRGDAGTEKRATPPPQTAERGARASLIRVIAARVATNVPAYLTRDIPSTLAIPAIKGTPIDNWLSLAALGLFGAAGVLALARSLLPVLIFLASYGALLVVWPYVISRYLFPYVPWLVLLLLSGSSWIGERLGGRWRALLPTIFSTVMIAWGISALSDRTRDARSCDRRAAFSDPDCFSEPQRAFFAAAAEAGRTTPSSAVFLSSKEGTLYYLTGRRSVRELEAVQLDAPQLRAYLGAHGAEYILLSHTHIDQWALARPLRKLCASLEVVRVLAEHTVLLRIVPGTARDGGRAGCAAIERYATAPW